MKKHQEVALVGGGLPSLILALQITEANPDISLTIVEKAAKLGGSYQTFNYGKEGGLFDHGMHIIYETCVPEIDRTLNDLLEKDQWHYLEGNRKDIAGIFYNGKLQDYSPYVDLRDLPPSKREQMMSELEATFSGQPRIPNREKNISAKEYFENQFGKTIANEIFKPILKKLYAADITEIDVLATRLTAMNRVVLFDPKVVLDLMKVPELQSRIAFPDQLHLPACRPNNQRGLYPKKFGMFHVIEKIEEKLRKRGVQILLEAAVSKLDICDARVNQLEVKIKKENKILKVDELYWTAGPLGLAPFLGISLKDYQFEKKNRSVFVNIRFDKPVQMGELYYFYCFDSPYSTFRVTNYGNYCPAARNDGNHPVCVELWLKNEDEAPEALALKELKAFGVITDDHRPLFVKAEAQSMAFPQPTIHNLKQIADVNSKIKSRGLENLISTGILAEDGLFFVKDVLIDSFHKAKARKHIHV